MRLNKIDNVSFKSTMLIEASPKQMKGFEMRLNREAMAEVPVYSIQTPEKKHPPREPLSNFDAETQIFEAYKTGEYKTHNFVSHMPSQRFSVSVTMVKEGVNGGNSTYLVATHNEAEMIERLKSGIGIIKDKVQIYQRALTKTHNIGQQNKIFNDLDAFKKDEMALTNMLGTYIGKFTSEAPQNVKNIFQAIREKRFNFGILSFVEKTFLLKV